MISTQPDISFFDAVPTQLLPGDRRSILTVQQLVATRFGRYAYLEIGSYLGGSLQPHLRDQRCSAIYSIDPRPRFQPDERGEDFEYPDNTTQRMLDELAPAYGPFLSKLTCFERDAADLRLDEIPTRPQLCLIDGEHTDRAVLSDFRACLRLAARPCVTLFDDAHIVYRGIAACRRELDERGEAYRAYVLPQKIGVIEVGSPGLYREAPLLELLATADAYLTATESLDHYRRIVMSIKDIPGVRLARRMQHALLRRKGAIGGSPSR
jgi:hypothetical protein